MMNVGLMIIDENAVCANSLCGKDFKDTPESQILGTVCRCGEANIYHVDCAPEVAREAHKRETRRLAAWLN